MPSNVSGEEAKALYSLFANPDSNSSNVQQYVGAIHGARNNMQEVSERK